MTVSGSLSLSVAKLDRALAVIEARKNNSSRADRHRLEADQRLLAGD